jgi:hypothetical protein
MKIKTGTDLLVKISYQKNRTLILLLISILWIAILSDKSGFYIKDVYSMNSDIAIMLTPAGMINNFFILKDSYLKPYYQELVQRGQIMTDIQIKVLVSLCFIFGLLGFINIRKNFKNEY